jgi:hypothetical protein
MPPDVVCRITQSQPPPENTSVAPACWVRGLAARIQRYTTWERGLPARLQRYATWVRRRPARMPGARASSLPQRYAPLGCAGVQPACRERGRLAHVQRCDITGTWASRPRPPCGSGDLSRVDFLGDMGGFLHFRALLPLIPPPPFSHTGRRGSLGVLKPRMRKGMQGLPKNPPL